MSENSVSIDRSYIDNFSVKDFTVNNLIPKYFPNEDVSDRSVGMIGLTTEQISNISEDVFNTASVLFRESFPNRSEIDESIYSHASLFQLTNIFSTAASCTFLLFIDENAVINNKVKADDTNLYYFYIDKNLEFDVEGVPFVLDYDIKIRVVQKYNEDTDEYEYIYSGSYILDESNSISDITDPYIKIRRTARNSTDSISILGLEVKCHQCYREERYENIINNSKINYPIINIPFDGKIAGFDIYYKSPDSEDYTQMTKKLIYSQPITEPFCYYYLSSEGNLRITFNSKDYYWMPEFNSELKIILYKTLGSDGNFTFYTGSNYTIYQDTDRYKYSDKYVMAVKAMTSSVGGSDQFDLEKLKALTLEGYRTANALTTENDLVEYFSNYKHRFGNSDILFLKKRDDVFERLFSGFIIMSNGDKKYKTSTLNLDGNLYELSNPENNLYIIEPGTLFVSPDIKQIEFLKDSEISLNKKIRYLTDCNIYSPNDYGLEKLYKIVEDNTVITNDNQIHISEVMETLVKYKKCEYITKFDSGVDYYIYDEELQKYIQIDTVDGINEDILNNGGYYIQIKPDIVVGDYVSRNGYRKATENDINDGKALIVIPSAFIDTKYQMKLSDISTPYFNGNPSDFINQIIKENYKLIGKLNVKDKDLETGPRYAKLIPVLLHSDAIKENINGEYKYCATATEITDSIEMEEYNENVSHGCCFVRLFGKYNKTLAENETVNDVLYEQVNITSLSNEGGAPRYYIKNGDNFELVTTTDFDSSQTYYKRTNYYVVDNISENIDTVTTVNSEDLGFDSSEEQPNFVYSRFISLSRFLSELDTSIKYFINGIDDNDKFIVVPIGCDSEKVINQFKSENLLFRSVVYTNTLGYNVNDIFIGPSFTPNRVRITKGYFEPVEFHDFQYRYDNQYYLIEKDEYSTSDRQIDDESIILAHNEYGDNSDLVNIGEYVVIGGKIEPTFHFLDICDKINDGYIAQPKTDFYIQIDTSKENFNNKEKYYILNNFHQFVLVEKIKKFENNIKYYVHHCFTKSSNDNELFSVYDFKIKDNKITLDNKPLYDIDMNTFMNIMSEYKNKYIFTKENSETYYFNGQDYSRYYIIQQTDQGVLPEYLQNRICSLAEYSSRYNLTDDKIGLFDMSNDDLKSLDNPLQKKFLYINPFLLRFSKSPNILSYYLTYIKNHCRLDFTEQNDDSFIQFIMNMVNINRGFDKEKKYHISTRISTNISLQNIHYPISYEFNEETEEYTVVHYNYNKLNNVTEFEDNKQYFILTNKGYIEAYYYIENETYYERESFQITNRYYNHDEDLRTFFVICDSNGNNLCYTELIPTDFDGQSFLFEGDIYTDDHITSGSSSLLHILDKTQYYKIEYENEERVVDYYEINHNNPIMVKRYKLYPDGTIDYIGEYYKNDVDLSSYKKYVNTINMGSYDNINIPLENVTCKIYTVYRKKYDEKENDLINLTESDNPINPFQTYETNSDVSLYLWTNEYGTMTSPVTFIKQLNNVRSNLEFKDYTKLGTNGEYLNDVMDISIKSIPLIRWETCLDDESLDYFMTSFINQYNTLVSIIDNRLRNATDIDIKFYNTYGHANTYYIGEEYEKLNTVNLKLEFDMWFTNGIDLSIAVAEVKKFIKNEVEQINSHGTNNLHISNLMRKIEHNFDYVDHIRFKKINDYDTTYQTIRNVVVDLNELDKYERREYVPELLVIDLKNIIINEYTIM